MIVNVISVFKILSMVTYLDVDRTFSSWPNYVAKPTNLWAAIVLTIVEEQACKDGPDLGGSLWM